MAGYEDGARAIVRFQRIIDPDGNRIGGHVFIAEQRRRKTVFIDPQTGDANVLKHHFYDYKNPIKIERCIHICEKYEGLHKCRGCTQAHNSKKESIESWVGVDPESIRLLRVDNLKLTDLIRECVEDGRQ